MCTAGTLGFTGWAMSEMPVAKKRGILAGAGNLGAELGRELAKDGRAVDADLLEDAARHHAHDAAAAVGAGVVGAHPGLAAEAACRLGGAGELVLQRLEAGADVVAQRLEPAAGLHLAVGEVGRQGGRVGARRVLCLHVHPI
jgi:hypothetical protein